jgi:FkbM family methyltransferase
MDPSASLSVSAEFFLTANKPIKTSIIKLVPYRRLWKRVSTYAVFRLPSLFFKPYVLETALSLMDKSNMQISVFLRGIKEGDIVFDVGANIGEFTILLSHVVGPHGKVHAFEPVPETFQKLSQNIAKSPLKNQVVLNRCALSDHLGNAKIYVPISDLPFSGDTEASLTGHTSVCWESQQVKCFDCHLDTLDNYVEINHIDKIDFVKLDVEGAEMLVLRGMKNILQSPSPPMLMLEAFPFWMKDFGFSVTNLFQLLTEYGYFVYFLGKNKIVPCASAEEMLHLIRPSFGDFFCLVPHIHNDRMALLKKYLTQSD